MFRTEVHTSDSPIKIDYDSQILTLGSCFATNIGDKLVSGKFSTKVNPLGISFNPLSIFELIERATLEDSDLSDYYLNRDGLFYNYKLHSDFRFETKNEFDRTITSSFNELHKVLSDSSLIILTLGTAYIYERKVDQEIVSNCHKQPSQNFNKRLLTVEEIISGFFEMKEQLDKLNSKTQFLLTVSPVRHTKDTLEGNAVSKSILRTACHYISEMANEVFYYPAFEIMMDDLRDYRFYEADLIHPNSQGIGYIWNHFRESFFDEGTEMLYKKWSKLQRALLHKPFNPDSESHKKFLHKIEEELKALSEVLDLKNEINSLQKVLVKHG